MWVEIYGGRFLFQCIQCREREVIGDTKIAVLEVMGRGSVKLIVTT